MLTAANLVGIADAGVRHGFFTRVGGVSEGRLASLNCGYSGGDEPARVAENRARVARRLGLPPASLGTVRQVHGAAVEVVRTATPGRLAVEADALVTDWPRVTLGVTTADCAPVLIADPAAGVIGAAHAGWRGALAGVIEATVDTMVTLGAAPERMVAAVGPCIAEASYEVGPDLHGPVIAEDAGSASLFRSVAGSDRLHFDLKAYALRRLARAGVNQPLALPDDTHADEHRFFSARRSRQRGEERFGLLLSVIALTPDTA